MEPDLMMAATTLAFLLVAMIVMAVLGDLDRRREQDGEPPSAVRAMVERMVLMIACVACVAAAAVQIVDRQEQYWRRRMLGGPPLQKSEYPRINPPARLDWPVLYDVSDDAQAGGGLKPPDNRLAPHGLEPPNNPVGR